MQQRAFTSLGDLFAAMAGQKPLTDMTQADQLGVQALAAIERDGTPANCINNLIGGAVLIFLATRADDAEVSKILETMRAFTVTAVEEIFNELHGVTHSDAPEQVTSAPLNCLRIVSFLRGMSPNNTIPALTHDDITDALRGPIRVAGNLEADIAEAEIRDAQAKAEAAAEAAKTEVKH